MTCVTNLPPLVRGDTVPIEINITDVNGSPVNITGDLIFFTLKTDRTQSDAQAALTLKFTVPTGPYAVAGNVVITLKSTDTAALAAGKYYYDIQWVKAGTPPIVKTIFMGTVVVLLDSTIAVA